MNIQFLITLNSNTAKQCKYKKRYKELTKLKLKKCCNRLSQKYQKSETRKRNQLGETNKQTTTAVTTGTTKTKVSKKQQEQQHQKTNKSKKMMSSQPNRFL